MATLECSRLLSTLMLLLFEKKHGRRLGLVRFDR